MVLVKLGFTEFYSLFLMRAFGRPRGCQVFFGEGARGFRAVLRVWLQSLGL